jgi:hypothetical protein
MTTKVDADVQFSAVLPVASDVDGNRFSVTVTALDAHDLGIRALASSYAC